MNRTIVALLAFSGLAAVTAAQDHALPKPTMQPAGQPLQPNVKPGVVPSGPVSDTAKITFTANEQNFGVISDEKNVQGEFTFKNTGTTTLTIYSTSGSCGCTVPQLSKKDYAPGEEGSIKVEYHPQNRRGPQHTTVTVNTNDASQPSVRLDVKSEVRPQVMVDPPMISIGQLPKGKGGTFKATLTSRLKDVAPTSATPTIASLSAKVLPGAEVDLNGEKVMQYPIEITVPPEAAVGQVTGNISIRTSDVARVLNMTVTGEVIGDVVANPARLQIGSLAPGAPFTNEMRLTSRSGKRFKVSKIEEASGMPTKAFTSITFKESDAEPWAWVVTATGTASQAPGAIRGDLVLTTDIPGEEAVKLGYFGFVRAQPKPPSAWDNEPSVLVPGK